MHATTEQSKYFTLLETAAASTTLDSMTALHFLQAKYLSVTFSQLITFQIAFR